MPKHPEIQKVLVIGSGPIVIGQAAEFDYAGTQACLSLKEEGVEVVLVNNNPATTMTDAHLADRIYMEPLTAETLEQVIRQERPDGLLATLGGQTGLNLAVELAESGVLSRYGVKLLGTPLAAIQKGEDRELFRKLMWEIGEPVPESLTAKSVEEAVCFANQHGYPVIVRPAYTLGGLGGGIAEDENALREIAGGGLTLSPIHQVLVEGSIQGWKEIEYEVMRDENDTCIIVCNMENIDPVGVHTGDSVVVAPSQTLSDREYHMLRDASLHVIRALKVVGGCNIQFGLHPKEERYCVIEVNPRVSRSSALASKATGYPIARIAAKLALGYHLDELFNSVTGTTYASFEPVLDYVVVKIPRWPFDKFSLADRRLGTQMKATGEVMAMERNLEAALQKGIRSLEIGFDGLLADAFENVPQLQLEELVSHPDDRRLFVLAELLRRGVTVKRLHRLSQIDPFFLFKLSEIVRLEQALKDSAACEGWEQASPDLLQLAKRKGFADSRIARIYNVKETDVREYRRQWQWVPGYKQVDTCAAEFDAQTPYYYSTYSGMDEVSVSSDRPKVAVLGAGPIRIGQGIEFDYCSVHAAQSLQELGIEAVVINNNPETVSTDYQIADQLYFEPLVPEDVLNVLEKEKVDGVLVQFGGQTAIRLARPLAEAGIKLYGTSLSSIDAVEDRALFYRLLSRLNIPHIPGRSVAWGGEALEEAAAQLFYPVLIRPSYVIGGQSMVIVENEAQLKQYRQMLEEIPENERRLMYPLLVDRYVPGIEAEIDAICDGEEVLIPGVFQHVERAGIHSGDSVAVTPAYALSPAIIDKMVRITFDISREISAKGLMNIQFVIDNDVVYVLEVNPRASRTVPILSKVTGIPMVEAAVRVQLGERLLELPWGTGLKEPLPYYTVKRPVYSFNKLPGVDPLLGPEMKSTGEIIGVGESLEEAAYKAFHWDTASVKRVLSAGHKLLWDAKGPVGKNEDVSAHAVAGISSSPGIGNIDETMGLKHENVQSGLWDRENKLLELLAQRGVEVWCTKRSWEAEKSLLAGRTRGCLAQPITSLQELQASGFAAVYSDWRFFSGDVAFAPGNEGAFDVSASPQQVETRVQAGVHRQECANTQDLSGVKTDGAGHIEHHGCAVNQGEIMKATPVQLPLHQGNREDNGAHYQACTEATPAQLREWAERLGKWIFTSPETLEIYLQGLKNTGSNQVRDMGGWLQQSPSAQSASVQSARYTGVKACYTR